ncbi:hypothetical protein [Spirochaeta africana]|uniref:DUF305 domain-containing protein n=1 Tax=Spirochaeta africana (strain ATCC 700263 / DSM 8902 / Z-7692) TaxID=889378 RepID=H9UHN5_SPIAZ|nr:hypothetical protein [Spirochaeta africana]AFG37028.1 hypothetical protein Spiaf_0939 [Spirochaeta africana DSM 8902]
MNKKNLLIVFALMLAAVHWTVADAPLTEDLITQWVGSMEAIDEWGTDPANQLEDMDAELDPLDFEATFVQIAEQHVEIGGIVRDHGFSDNQEWAHYGSRIMYAYGALQMEADSPNVRQELQQQLELIEAQTELSEEQRAMMQQQLEQVMVLLDRMDNAPEADRAAVQQHASLLAPVFE